VKDLKGCFHANLSSMKFLKATLKVFEKQQEISLLKTLD